MVVIVSGLHAVLGTLTARLKTVAAHETGMLPEASLLISPGPLCVSHSQCTHANLLCLITLLFCCCVQKLEAAGFTLLSLKTADDAALRKAGIVVKAQRDKLLEAAKALY